MARARDGTLLAWLTLPGMPSRPAYHELYEQIRGAILAGRLAAGSRLPSTRTLAGELGLSRGTVTIAYEQLAVEGFVEGQVGSGTYVSRGLGGMPAPVASEVWLPPGPPATGFAARLESLALPVPGTPPFAPCVPDARLFPRRLWARLTGQHLAQGSEGLEPGELGGDPGLRAAVARHLATFRGVVCQPDEVVVLAGAQQALDLIGRLLFAPGDAVWVEDPGYLGARGAFELAGLRVHPVAVDGEGIDVAAGRREAPDARGVYVTPSHQFPLGVTLSLPRRLELLDWAAREGRWIIEDDYDSEFRYRGRSLAALRGLDRAGRVIYVGTFNKALFPGLRLAYVVAAAPLARALALAREHTSGALPTVTQRTLALFLEQGHYGRHLRRSRQLYRERQAALLAALGETAAATQRPLDTGLHLVLRLPAGTDDRALERAAADQGIVAPALSRYCRGPALAGLLLGYAHLTPQEIRGPAARLRRVLSRAMA